MTFIEAQLLKPEDRTEKEEHHDRLIDYLQKYHKDGFKMPCNITVNKKEIELDDYDMKLKDDDVIVLLHHQGVTAAVLGLSGVAGWLTATAINITISFALSKIFAPSTPSGQSALSSRNSAGQASSVYSLNSQQNEAKIGSVIPMIYGKIRTYPALITSPYYRYEDNEEYLYQLMCIGQGKFDIDNMMISDTDVTDIQEGNFLYEKLEYDDFKTVAGIAAKVNDSLYNGLVKTIPDIDNLELRGTPQNKAMTMRFDGSTIEFFPYTDGSYPDLSSLVNGSNINIEDTVSNDGDYLVSSVFGNVVTVQAHTFVTEPTDSVTIDATDAGIDSKSIILDDVRGRIESISKFLGNSLYSPLGIDVGSFFEFNGTTLNDGVLLQVLEIGLSDTRGYTEVDNTLIYEKLFNTTVDADYHAKTYLATFETSYGTYSYDKPHIGFEIDIVYPQGVYNTDASGNFTDRATNSSIFLNNSLIDETEGILTNGNLNSTPIRVTHKYIYALHGHAAIQDNMNLSFKRNTSEPIDVKSMDKTYIGKVKFILEEQNYEPLGDVTLLWCKIKATNAITSIGQFAINAWVTRNDIASDVKSVCTDIYSNDVYGGRLPESDLDFDETATYGEWKNDIFHFAELALTGFYNVQQFAAGVYLSQTAPPILIPFLGMDGKYYEIEALPTIGNNTAVREVFFDVVNGAIDSRMTLYDTMQMVAKSNNYSLYPVGGTLKLKHDTIKPIRTALYNETNILKTGRNSSLKISYLFSEEQSTDSVKISYRDADDFSDKTTIYPVDGFFPEEVELWGCTDDTIADNMAKYLYKQDRSRRKTVEFKTDIQGLIPQFLDRIGISHNLPKWGFGGQIKSFVGRVITLSCDHDLIAFPCDETRECDDVFFEECPTDSNYDTILFRNKNGDVSDLFTFTVIDSVTIELTTDAPTWLYSGEDYDRTFFSIGYNTSIVKDYIVTNIKPNGKEVTIQCVNYDESIYS